MGTGLILSPSPRKAGSRAPSQSSHSDEPRSEDLGEEEGGLWCRVIAGQKPACIAGRGTHLFSPIVKSCRLRQRGPRLCDTGGNRYALVALASGVVNSCLTELCRCLIEELLPRDGRSEARDTDAHV